MTKPFGKKSHKNISQRNGTKCNGVERSATEWNGVQRSGTECNGVERSATEWNGVQRSGTECKGVERSGIAQIAQNNKRICFAILWEGIA